MHSFIQEALHVWHSLEQILYGQKVNCWIFQNTYSYVGRCKKRPWTWFSRSVFCKAQITPSKIHHASLWPSHAGHSSWKLLFMHLEGSLTVLTNSKSYLVKWPHLVTFPEDGFLKKESYLFCNFQYSISPIRKTEILSGGLLMCHMTTGGKHLSSLKDYCLLLFKSSLLLAWGGGKWKKTTMWKIGA